MFMCLLHLGVAPWDQGRRGMSSPDKRGKAIFAERAAFAVAPETQDCRVTTFLCGPMLPTKQFIPLWQLGPSTSVLHISNNSRRCLQISTVICYGPPHSALIDKTDNVTFKSLYLFNFGAIQQILHGCCSRLVGTSSVTSDISMTCDIVDVTCMTMWAADVVQRSRHSLCRSTPASSYKSMI